MFFPFFLSFFLLFLSPFLSHMDHVETKGPFMMGARCDPVS
jgi:hypothetical protein